MKIKSVLGGFALLASLGTAHAETTQATCPNDFDPDDSAWVMTAGAPLQNGFQVIRLFSYQPNPGLRAAGKFVPQCNSMLTSYDIGNREKRMWKIVYRGSEKRYFLADENGAWHEGDVQTNLAGLEEKMTPGGTITFTLMREKKSILTRNISIPHYVSDPQDSK